MQIPSAKTNNTILIVDDEDSILRILEIGLTNKGYDVLIARSGIEALEIAAKRRFRFTVLDVRLPDMNGIELGWQIKKLIPEVYNIIMTGYPEVQSAVEALRRNAYDYLTKPFTIDQVLSVVEKAKREIQLIGEKKYYAEIIRTLREENEQLKTMLREKLPSEQNPGSPANDDFKSIPSGNKDILLLNSRQKIEKIS